MFCDWFQEFHYFRTAAKVSYVSIIDSVSFLNKNQSMSRNILERFVLTGIISLPCWVECEKLPAQCTKSVHIDNVLSYLQQNLD